MTHALCHAHGLRLTAYSCAADGCYQAPVTLGFDEATVSGTSSPDDGALSSTIRSPFTYHGLAFSASSSTEIRLANQDFMYRAGAASYSNSGFVSTPSTNLLVEATTATLTITTGGGTGGLLKAFSVFIGQPTTTTPSISFIGYRNGAVVCAVGLPAGSATSGYTLSLGRCTLDTLVFTGSGAAGTNVLTIDTLLVCAATPVSALTASP